MVRNSRNHAVWRRTPRIPVIAPADRSTIDDATPGIENVINSTKRKYEAANYDCSIVPTNEYSPDRVSGFAEANKVGLDFKKTRIQQTMAEGQTGIVEHEMTMASKEGNKLVDSLNNNQMLIDSISEGTFSNWSILFTFIDKNIHYLCRLYFLPCFQFHFLYMKYFILVYYYGTYSDLLTFCILDFQAMF